MSDLKVFQLEASKLMADRYAFFANHPYRPHKGNVPRPFFQALSALTGAGKTLILAEAVTLMRSHFSLEPIVLWMSKAKSVVAQTYANFSSGGKYNKIIQDFNVVDLSQLNLALLNDDSKPLMIIITTGVFNNKEQSEGVLNIYRSDKDRFGDQSPWDRLIERAGNRGRRPLLIVYDEGHNLSEQQAELLAKLDPDAYLLASATLKLPDSFNKSVIQPIKLWFEEIETGNDTLKTLDAVDENGKPDFKRYITTTVDSAKVVEAQLVKRAIQFDGTTASMERCLDNLVSRMESLTEEIDACGLGFKPKAIYVCKTNIASDGEKDDHTSHFLHRKAPPILIWRYLVEEKGIDPKSIAIYANLNFTDGNKPDDVNLFSKGENDFDEFTSGDYQHIIFNLSLQEGWDDPSCYLAYVDKSMGSSIQVEQVIGRVLRQYEVKHYDNPLLNSAHFFLRVDSQSVFADAIDAVKSKLQAEGSPIDIVSNYGDRGEKPKLLKPKDNIDVSLCHIHVDAEAACERIDEIIKDFPTFAEGSPDTCGQAHIASQIIDMKDPGIHGAGPKWTAEGHTNPVRLRWLINMALRSRSSRALAICKLNDPKFDVPVQIQSIANKAADKVAREIVEAYYQHADLVYETMQPFHFGAIPIAKNPQTFENGLYEQYANLNNFESSFALALDKVGHVWHRNPVAGGFYIPLLSEGDTASFYPDFIVWKDDNIYCLDTKGSHLLSDAVARKLFDIQDGGTIKLRVRFISEGKQTELRGKSIPNGYTVWKMKAGTPTPIHVDDLDHAVKECLKP